MSKKPPIGLKPREINDENRFANVREAMVRYLNSGLVIPQEWVDEYNLFILAKATQELNMLIDPTIFLQEED